MNKRILIVALLYHLSAITFASQNQVYLGLFGGGGTTNDDSFRQIGTAFYSSSSGGPLNVNAHSRADTDSAGVGGLHIGYMGPEKQLGQAWGGVPAAELEGYYLGVTEDGGLYNPSNRVPEHLFEDAFPINAGVFLANAVFTLNLPGMNKFHPYIGGGVGATYLSISGATSKQVNPAEPGINHFNSNPNASTWAYATQAKAGLKFNVADHWNIFAEYRYLYLASTTYTFGSTQYASHVPTSNWTVHFANINCNLGSVGIQYTV